MKNYAILAIALMGAAALSGCDSKSKLAKEIQGEWTSAPELLVNTGATRASLVRVAEFDRAADAAEGTVKMTALITVENTIPANDSIVTPLTITASGTAAISGFYTVKDDDELKLNLDASTLSIAVDPEAVKLDYDIIDGRSGSSLEQLRPGALRLARQQINRAAQDVFFNLDEIDDIRIDNNLMSCEIGHKDLTFRRAVPGK